MVQFLVSRNSGGFQFYLNPIFLLFFFFQVLLNSKLPVDILGRIWDLSDVDKDGFLDKDEFAVVSLFYSLQALSIFRFAEFDVM